MAAIISLNAHRDLVRDRRESAFSASGTCEIVIFPGFRYERWDEPDPKPTSRGNGKRKRVNRPN